jgi:hypothetical protein
VENAAVADGERSHLFSGRNVASRTEIHCMPTLRDMLDLELRLLRRGLDERLAGSERCTCCHRTPLVGERVYVYGSGTIACELCRDRQREDALETRTVHGPEFGHTMRITDQRAAA